jgi:quinol---cytochrome-c reductase cytochrome c subunit
VSQKPSQRALAAVACAGMATLPMLAPSPSAPTPSSSAGPVASSPAGSPASSPAGSAASSAPAGSAVLGGDRGAVLYQQSCASCHGQQGEGSQRGPAIAGVGAASVDFQLSTGRMPLAQEQYSDVHRDPAFSPADISALVGYVAALPPGGGPPVPTVRAGDTKSGRELYLTYCSACHSAAGVGATLTNGRFAPSLQKATPTQIGEAIRVGPGLMPAFNPQEISDTDVDSIAAYVGVLQNHHGNLDRGGFSLARLGPFPEGAVAWVVGLGLIALLARKLGSRAQ